MECEHDTPKSWKTVRIEKKQWNFVGSLNENNQVLKKIITNKDSTAPFLPPFLKPNSNINLFEAVC